MSFNKHQWADWVHDNFIVGKSVVTILALTIGVIVANLAILAAGVWVVVWVLQSAGVL